MLKKTTSLLLIGILISVITGCAHHHGKKRVYSKSAGTVLVAGATGRTGRIIVDKLLDQGYTVRAFVRNPEKAEKLFGNTVEIAVGDVKAPQSIAAAMPGARWVISAIGAGGSNSKTNLPEFVDFGGTKNLVEAAVNAKVAQFIMISSRSAGKKDHVLNQRYNNVLLWKLKGENVLRESGLHYTIIRPGGLRDEPGGVTTFAAFQTDTPSKLRMIPRADVATVCVAALNNTDAYHKTLVILSNPEAEQRPWKQFFSNIPKDNGPRQ